jgi:hypothetical protein
MNEKTPLQQLQEWQELSDHFRALHPKGVVSPENTLSVGVEGYLEPLSRETTLEARWTLNGEKFTQSTTFYALGSEYKNGRCEKSAEAVSKLAGLIAKDITRGLEEEMYRLLLSSPNSVLPRNFAPPE